MFYPKEAEIRGFWIDFWCPSVVFFQAFLGTQFLEALVLLHEWVLGIRPAEAARVNHTRTLLAHSICDVLLVIVAIAT